MAYDQESMPDAGSREDVVFAGKEIRDPLVGRLLLAGLVVFFLIASAWGLYGLFSTHQGLAIWDFHPRWLGLRAMFQAGQNPYGEEVTLEIQRQMYGRPARPGEDQIAFAYPLHVMAVFGPLSLLPLPVAQTLWFLLLEVSLAVFFLVGPRAVGWSPPTWLLGMTAVFILCLYPDVWAIILGQISIFIAALVALAWWFLRTRRWIAAGVCLALVTMKPQMAFLLVPAVLIWAAWQRRWRLLAAFGLTFGVLVLLPLPWLPDWPLKWLAAAGRYAGYTVFDPPLVMLTGSNWSAWALAGLLLAWMGWRCWRTDRCQGNSPAWAMSLLIVLTALIAPRTSQANQLVLLLPLFLVFSRLERAWIVALVEVVLVAGLWLIDATMLPPVSSPQHVVWQHRIISPILPLGLALALLVLSPRPTPGEEK